MEVMEAMTAAIPLTEEAPFFGAVDSAAEPHPEASEVLAGADFPEVSAEEVSAEEVPVEVGKILFGFLSWK